MPAFGGVTGRVYCKAWRVPTPGPRQRSSCTASASTQALYHWLGTHWTASASTVGATRSAAGSPRTTSGIGRASIEFAKDKLLESVWQPAGGDARSW